MQCPTLVRLPPGVTFSDDGVVSGRVRFDPHRDAEYRVEFVAVSTADWDDTSIGLCLCVCVCCMCMLCACVCVFCVCAVCAVL